MTVFLIVWLTVGLLAAVAIGVFFELCPYKGWISRRTGEIVVPAVDVDLAIGCIVFWPLALFLGLFVGFISLIGWVVSKAFGWLCARIRSLAGLP